MDFDPEPLGAASLAQVHRATLRDGSVVAVKVQHLHVKEHTFVDMKTMEVGTGGRGEVTHFHMVVRCVLIVYRNRKCRQHNRDYL